MLFYLSGEIKMSTFVNTFYIIFYCDSVDRQEILNTSGTRCTTLQTRHRWKAVLSEAQMSLSTHSIHIEDGFGK